jgi:hypothetical protein
MVASSATHKKYSNKAIPRNMRAERGFTTDLLCVTDHSIGGSR